MKAITLDDILKDCPRLDPKDDPLLQKFSKMECPDGVCVEIPTDIKPKGCDDWMAKLNFSWPCVREKLRKAWLEARTKADIIFDNSMTDFKSFFVLIWKDIKSVCLENYVELRTVYYGVVNYFMAGFHKIAALIQKLKDLDDKETRKLVLESIRRECVGPFQTLGDDFGEMFGIAILFIVLDWTLNVLERMWGMSEQEWKAYLAALKSYRELALDFVTNMKRPKWPKKLVDFLSGIIPLVAVLGTVIIALHKVFAAQADADAAELAKVNKFYADQIDRLMGIDGDTANMPLENTNGMSGTGNAGNMGDTGNLSTHRGTRGTFDDEADPGENPMYEGTVAGQIENAQNYQDSGNLRVSKPTQQQLRVPYVRDVDYIENSQLLSGLTQMTDISLYRNVCACLHVAFAKEGGTEYVGDVDTTLMMTDTDDGDYIGVYVDDNPGDSMDIHDYAWKMNDSGVEFTKKSDAYKICHCKKVSQNVKDGSNSSVFVLSVCPIDFDNTNILVGENAPIPPRYIVDMGLDINDYEFYVNVDDVILPNQVIAKVEGVPVKSILYGKVIGVSDRYFIVDGTEVGNIRETVETRAREEQSQTVIGKTTADTSAAGKDGAAKTAAELISGALADIDLTVSPDDLSGTLSRLNGLNLEQLGRDITGGAQTLMGMIDGGNTDAIAEAFEEMQAEYQKAADIEDFLLNYCFDLYKLVLFANYDGTNILSTRICVSTFFKTLKKQYEDVYEDFQEEMEDYCSRKNIEKKMEKSTGCFEIKNYVDYKKTIFIRDLIDFIRTHNRKYKYTALNPVKPDYKMCDIYYDFIGEHDYKSADENRYVNDMWMMVLNFIQERKGLEFNDIDEWKKSFNDEFNDKDTELMFYKDGTTKRKKDVDFFAWLDENYPLPAIDASTYDGVYQLIKETFNVGNTMSELMKDSDLGNGYTGDEDKLEIDGMLSLAKKKGKKFSKKEMKKLMAKENQAKRFARLYVMIKITEYRDVPEDKDKEKLGLKEKTERECEEYMRLVDATIEDYLSIVYDDGDINTDSGEYVSGMGTLGDVDSIDDKIAGAGKEGYSIKESDFDTYDEYEYALYEERNTTYNPLTNPLHKLVGKYEQNMANGVFDSFLGCDKALKRFLEKVKMVNWPDPRVFFINNIMHYHYEFTQKCIEGGATMEEIKSVEFDYGNLLNGDTTDMGLLDAGGNRGRTGTGGTIEEDAGGGTGSSGESGGTGGNGGETGDNGEGGPGDGSTALDVIAGDDDTAAAGAYGNDVGDLYDCTSEYRHTDYMYWLKYCGIATLYNCTLPLFWGTGFLTLGVPTPLPIVLVPIKYFKCGNVCPFLLGVGICGISVMPFMLYINNSKDTMTYIFAVNLAIGLLKDYINEVKASSFRTIVSTILQPLVDSMTTMIEAKNREIDSIRREIAELSNI